MAEQQTEGGEAIVSTDPAADLQRERDDYYDRWMRKAAEFENYRKRVERERREQADQAVLDLLQELLLVVDDFDRATALQAPGDAAAYKKGVALIHSKLHDLLKKQGVRPIEALGADFDPNVHQAVMHEAAPGHRDNEVIGELRKGYMMGDRLLRPAMVKVAKA
ncbi:MAG TPA: nucleotide exchange factor GrpE [Vicinamibacterales bacterium]|nr:nucleotide exchange factor GrpE [Vicinamibacterales bacterium]